MNARPPHPVGKPRPHRMTSFRAGVERLDRRELMAAGVTGTVIPVNGNVGTPLLVENIQDYMPGLGGVPLEPVGTPIPLVRLTTTASTLPATGYTGTVDWGDGSTPDAAQFGQDKSSSSLGVPANELDVNGPEHTYTTPGTYTITVSVTGPGDTAPTVSTTTATISTAPGVTGQINSAIVGALVANHAITADKTPNFTGTTQPGATVVLTAESFATAQSLVVGTAVADAAGNWSITTVPFVDGTYVFTATATSTFGGTTSQVLTGNPLKPYNNFFDPYYVVIDATGPKVAGFEVTHFKTGGVEVYYYDPAGVVINSTVAPGLYAVSRTSPAPARGQAFTVTNLSAQVPTDVYVGPSAATLVPVVGKFTTGKPIPRNGTYIFTIASGGVVDLLGMGLDGEFAGNFPSGNGQAGGNFQVKITVRNGVVSGPLPVGSTTTRATAATVPAAAARPHVRGIKH